MGLNKQKQEKFDQKIKELEQKQQQLENAFESMHVERNVKFESLKKKLASS